MIKRNIKARLRGNKEFKSAYLLIPPDLVRLLGIRDGDIFKVKYKSGTISYARDRTQSKPNTIVG